MVAAGDLNEAVAFYEPVQAEGPGGVVSTVWMEMHRCRAQFIYSRGSEVVEAARLEGRPIYKIRIRQCILARRISTNWQMRDSRRLDAKDYSIREVDSITDRQWIYMVIEGGKTA